MPRCYLLALTSGSSLDQQSNNVSLFSLVEQVNVPPGAPPPPQNRIPLEIHAYFHVDGAEQGKNIAFRFVLVGPTGLETFADPIRHRVATPRFRTRSVGLPFPPALGHYELKIEFRVEGNSTTPSDSGFDDMELSRDALDASEWQRDPLSYPIAFLEVERQPKVTH